MDHFPYKNNPLNIVLQLKASMFVYIHSIQMIIYRSLLWLDTSWLTAITVLRDWEWDIHVIQTLQSNKTNPPRCFNATKTTRDENKGA